MGGISTFLWFDDQAVAAARHYLSIFPNSRLHGEPADDAMTVAFELDGRPFTALNGGPLFAFTPAISFVVSCADQSEVDFYAERLSEGGSEGQCGWVTDKFGLSWQVVPSVLGELMGDPDPVKAGRVTTAMLAMHRLDIQTLMLAHSGGSG